jgi:hypothetical protein
VGPSALAQTLRFKPPAATETDGFDQVLARHAKPAGFDYAGLARDADAKHKLTAYVRWVGGLDEQASLADLLNAYNAVVIARVAAKPELASDATAPGFYDRDEQRIAGRMRTLDAVESRLIRKRFKEPRTHFALACSTRSCPGLWPRAFRPDTLDASLSALTKDALSDRRLVKVNDDAVEVSSMFFAHQRDFECDGGTLRTFLERYGDRKLRAALDAGRPLKPLQASAP